MKTNTFAKKYCISSLCIFSITAFMQNASAQYNNNLKPSQINSPAPKLEFELTVASLDDAWSKREDVNTQQKLMSFLKKEPTVPANYEVAWRVGRLVYYSGNFGLGEKQNTKEKENLFKYGYLIADYAARLSPNKVEGHYWYAVDLGSYGLAKGIFSSLRNAPKGRDALLKAISIDPSYHWGGAYRILGRYYQELPKFISFGDKDKALECFQNAVKVFPNYRPNKVDLAILLGDTGKKDAAIKLLKEANQLPDVDGMEEELHYKRILASSLKKLED